MSRLKVWHIVPPRIQAMMTGVVRVSFLYRKSDPEDLDQLPKSKRVVTLHYEDGTQERGLVMVPQTGFFAYVSAVQDTRKVFA